MISMELTSPTSYKGNDIKKWAEKNASSNDIARRLYRKYFNLQNQKTIGRSFYFVNVTSNGGVLLKRDLSRSPKSQVNEVRAS